MTTELQLAPNSPIMNVDAARPFNIESMFLFALEHRGSAETIERLMAVRRELNEEAAKKAFDEAMSAFQSECPPIEKQKGVPTATGQLAYHYAPIESIEIQIRPFLKQRGFSHTFDTDTSSQDGWVIARCIVTHCAGHSRTSTAKFPLGAKTNIMSATQQYAAALTFANRRALCNAYGLVLVGEDMDGSTGKIKQAGPSKMRPDNPALKALANELWSVLKSVRGTENNWTAANQWLWKNEILDGAVPEEAPNLTPQRFREVIEKAKGALA